MENLDVKKLVEVLLQGSDEMIDDRIKSAMRKWSDPPKSIEVLEVLDECIHGALATGVAIVALQAIYDDRCRVEQISHEANLKFATWRDR